MPESKPFQRKRGNRAGDLPEHTRFGGRLTLDVRGPPKTTATPVANDAFQAEAVKAPGRVNGRLWHIMLAMRRGKILMLGGASGVGKTTVCHRAAMLARERGRHVAGLLMPARTRNGVRCGQDVEDLSTGERRHVAEKATATGPACLDRWHFDEVALAWGRDVLRRATPCDLLIIDEVGPLELQAGRGWTNAVEILRAARFDRALVVVRDSLASAFRERMGRDDLSSITVTPANRDSLPALLLAASDDLR